MPVRSLGYVTFLRLISPALRSGLMIAAGTALILLPFPIGASAAVIMTGIAVGAVAVALGLAGTASEGRGTLPLSAQATYDRGLAVGLFLIAALFASAGDAAGIAIFASAGAATLAISVVTSYSAHTAV
jgi:hypothetical protein